MSVGSQPSKQVIDQQLTYLALQLRNIMVQIRNLNTQVGSSTQALQYLAGIGYPQTDNTSNPGGMSDAAYAAALISQLYVIAGLYYGVVAVPVTVAATAPDTPAAGSYWVNTSAGGQLMRWDGTEWNTFSFDSALAVLWNGA